VPVGQTGRDLSHRPWHPSYAQAAIEAAFAKRADIPAVAFWPSVGWPLRLARR